MRSWLLPPVEQMTDSASELPPNEQMRCCANMPQRSARALGRAFGVNMAVVMVTMTGKCTSAHSGMFTCTGQLV